MCQVHFPHRYIQDDSITVFTNAAAKISEQISNSTKIIYNSPLSAQHLHPITLRLPAFRHQTLHSYCCQLHVLSLSTTLVSWFIHFIGCFFIMCSSKRLTVARNQPAVTTRIELVAHSHNLYNATN